MAETGQADVDNNDFFSPKTIHSLLDTAVQYPKKHQNVVKELLHVFKATDTNSKCLQITLAFHKSSRPAAVFILERRLFASGILSEENMAKPCLSSLLSKILFGVVTTSSTECADYCANVWIERVEAQQRKKLAEPMKLALPNPMDFINRNDLTSLHSIILASLRELTTEQWHMLLLECTALLDIIPHQFYSGVIVGLFCFVQFYESYLSVGNECSCLAKIEDWTDIWIHLLASSLLGKFNGSQQRMQPQTNNFIPSVHHLLCGLMVATDSFKLLKSYSITCRKVLKGLDRLILNSSGFTSLWLQTMKFYFEFQQKNEVCCVFKNAL